MGVDGKDLATERIHHDAAGDLLPDPWELRKEFFALRVGPMLQRGQCQSPEAVQDVDHDTSNRSRLVLLESTAGKGFCDLALRGVCKITEGSKRHPKFPVCSTVTCLGSSGAADDKEEFFERISSVVMSPIVITHSEALGHRLDPIPGSIESMH